MGVFAEIMTAYICAEIDKFFVRVKIADLAWKQSAVLLMIGLQNSIPSLKPIKTR